MKLSHTKKKKIYICILVILVCTSITQFYSAKAEASSFSSYILEQSSIVQGATSTDTPFFTTATASTLDKIIIQYATTSGGNTKPAGLQLTSVTLGALTGLDSSWTLDLSSAASGIINLTSTGQYIAANTQVLIPLQNIVNATIGDCNPGGVYKDTCYVTVTTQTGAAGVVDTGVALYTLQDSASFSLTIKGTNAGSTVNGITTTSQSSYNSINFGDLIPGQVAYASQKITVKTNDPKGYYVYMETTTPMQGAYSGASISPFAAAGATWSTPVAWSSPTGTTAGVNTGWIGANTSDTRVTGWTSASAEFAPVQASTDSVVMTSPNADSGTTTTISYGCEVNIYQPADTYSAAIEYIAVSSY